ncbi:MAG: arginase family protein [Desulfosarcina sp.]
MNSHSTPFLGLAEAQTRLEAARVVVLPFGYEGGVSGATGAAAAPQAVLQASAYLELYDEVLDDEPCRVGIATVEQPALSQDPEAVLDTLETLTGALLDQGKFVVVIGGDHSITTGYVRALASRHNAFGVLQLDAHADLRESYEGTPLSHASVMARIREITPHTLQIGIRSISAQEARLVKAQKLALYPMHRFRRGGFDLEAALKRLPEQVFINVDVDVFDCSVIASTVTPEPGGMLWPDSWYLALILGFNDHLLNITGLVVALNAEG